MDTDLEQFYTTSEVASKLKVHVETVKRWLRNGDMEGIRIGGRWRISEDAVQKFIDTHKEAV